jgi:DNA-binding IclR family transcriptional regulator
MSDSGISTLDRLCSILNSFNENDRVLTLTEISRRVKLPKSTTHRLLEALDIQGMISSDPENHGYQLGYQLIYWGTLALNSLDLRKTALPVLQELSENTGESAVLSVRFGNVGSWIEMVESSQPVRLAMRLGKPLNLHAGASSKVLWAFLPEIEIEHILAEINLIPLKKNTITDPEKMREELRAIRQRGYSTSFEETDNDAMGIAGPVYDHTNRPVAGIGIVAPISRVPPQQVPQMVPFVLDACQELSRRLGASVRLPQPVAPADGHGGPDR